MLGLFLLSPNGFMIPVVVRPFEEVHWTRCGAAVAVDTSMTISQFINDYVFHYHYRVFPVWESGRFRGVIDVRSIKGVSPADWPTTKIGRIYPILPDTACWIPVSMLRMLCAFC